MHIILSHEQGDFDSLGSLLGAFLLNQNAIPVLQRRYNRNVRAFLNLYRPDFPFKNPQEVPDEMIETVTLVDTQSVPTIKGLGHTTRVIILDHHPERQDNPKNWEVTIDHVGACTTLLVERLKKYAVELNPIQATLLLLGIYEDTGSLTYESTTPRDLQASAYLLENGGSLRIVNKYLNPPLSPEQQQLYDSLLASVETHHIHDLNILVACSDAGKMTDEVSSIAHKMRDLLDPDALFILVSTLEGVRLVARSTTDQVNVAAIATHFGGGGHGRAASALIHLKSGCDEKSLNIFVNAVREELLQNLANMILPAITVGQIMSHRPLTISPQTSAEEAAQLMKRYGYEGYPVVHEGKVLGLLTRRAVDRSLSHKLNLLAGSLMHAGEVTVDPTDSLEHLQKVMTKSGWGQIPVLDPKSRMVIGIVTRTDLFRQLSSGKTLVPTTKNLIESLKIALPPARLGLLNKIVEIACERSQAMYIVGGFVRDLLLNRPSVDFDLVVEGNAIDLANTLQERFGGKVVSHKRFGTAKWSIAEIRSKIIIAIQNQEILTPLDLPASLDFISARTEFYDYPTALPTVERSNIKLDLRRRDFSINTLALRLDGGHYGELYDFWGGYNDLHQGRIRVLHSLSFIDDPTRMLRAVRFEQRFNFLIEPHTLRWMEEALPLLGKVTGHRLRHELDLMLDEENVTGMLNRLDQLNLLQSIHHALCWSETEAAELKKILSTPADFWESQDHFAGLPAKVAVIYLIWLSGLPLILVKDISKRLRFSRKLESALENCTHLRQELPTLTTKLPSEVARRLIGTPLIVLYALNGIKFGHETSDVLEKYFNEWRHIRPKTNGKALQELGVTPGPIYQQVLTRLQAAWLDGEIHSPDEERPFIEQMLSKLKVEKEK